MFEITSVEANETFPARIFGCGLAGTSCEPRLQSETALPNGRPARDRSAFAHADTGNSDSDTNAGSRSIAVKETH